MQANGVLNGVLRSPGFRAAAHVAQPAATVPPPERMTQAELEENLLQRLRAIFLRGPGAPRRSMMDPVADKAYLWLLVAVKKVVTSFWNMHAHATRTKLTRTSAMGE